jgi:hypothetical protein
MRWALQKIAVYSLLLLIVICYSCSKDSGSQRVSEMQPPVITGYIIRDNYGQYVAKEGDPNVNNFYYGGTPGYLLTSYPNPASSRISIEFQTPDTASKLIWIVNATTGYPVSYIAGSQNFITAGLPFQRLMSGHPLGGFLVSLLPGYYRVYMQEGQVLLWDNIVIQ